MQSTEILVRQLLWLHNRPPVLYLHAAWRFDDGGPPFHADAAEQHRHVLDYYDIPQVSMLALFQPLWMVERREWVQEVYFNDCCHPSRVGHLMIASVLAFVVRRAMAASVAFVAHPWHTVVEVRGHLPSEIPVLTDVPRDVLQRHEAAAVRNEAAFSADFTREAGPCNATGRFRCGADAPGQYGLIATQIGAVYHLNLTEVLASERAEFYTQVDYVLSHRHMGRARLSMQSFSCSDASALRSLYSVWVDCIRADRNVTELATTVLPWSRQQLGPEDDCVTLHVQVITTQHGRPENKVKLLHVMVF